MGKLDAERKFFEAVQSFRTADEKARSGGFGSIDAKAFQMVIIDLDAAIPGLDGLMLGRALILKAQCIYWLDLEKLGKSTEKSLVFDVSKDYSADPLLKEGLSIATRGRQILVEFGGTEELPWADDIVNRFKAMVEPSKK